MRWRGGGGPRRARVGADAWMAQGGKGGSGAAVASLARARLGVRRGAAVAACLARAPRSPCLGSASARFGAREGDVWPARCGIYKYGRRSQA
jgi:hypothetical protein